MCSNAASHVFVVLRPPVSLLMKRLARDLNAELLLLLLLLLLLRWEAFGADVTPANALDAGRLYCRTLASAAAEGRKRLGDFVGDDADMC